MLERNILNVGTSVHGFKIKFRPLEAFIIAVRQINELSQMYATSIFQVFQIGKKYMNQDGGKITEKANAKGNASDTGNHNIKQYYKHQTFTKNGQNSALLISTYKRPSLSTASYYTRERRNRVFVKSMSTLTWPKN